MHKKPQDMLEFFRRASHCFGRSALMLSGGGVLGFYHLGVVKTLLDQGLLPRVISRKPRCSLASTRFHSCAWARLRSRTQG